MDDGGSPNTTGWFHKMKGPFRKTFRKLPFVDTEDVTEEEIISMVKEGHEQGVLMENEAEMIHNIFAFGDKEAKDIMTHRKNMIALDGESTFEEAIAVMVASPNSRFPVYLDNIDNIIGVLHIKEALAKSQDHSLMQTPIKDIEGLVLDADFIPETRNINALFQEMQAAKNHLAIVVDEYGQTAGLVAMEDIIEEIVGNIFDEHDTENVFIEEKPDGTYIMKGMTPLEEISEVLGLNFEDEDYDTLNGFIISQIDKIPNDHERFRVDYENYTFEVLSVEDKIIQTVHVIPRQEQAAEGERKASCQKPEKMIE